MTTETLRALALNYETAVRASEAHEGSEAEFDRVIDEECAIARSIAFLTAPTLDDLAIKAVVALREVGVTKFKVGDRVDFDALLHAYVDEDRPDLAKLINVSIFLDIIRLTRKAVT